jgi:acyl carrier protein
VPTDAELTATIKRVLAERGGLAVGVDELDGAADLYEAGMTSFASVNVMLGLEDELEVEFEDHMLNRATFQTIDQVRDALAEVLGLARDGPR